MFNNVSLRRNRAAGRKILLTLLLMLSLFAVSAQAASMPKKAPGRVTGVKVTNLNASARVKWKPIKQVTGYEVWMKAKGEKTFTRVKLTKTPSVKITGLKNNQIYYIKINAYRYFDEKMSFKGPESKKTYIKPGTVKLPKVHNLWYRAVLRQSTTMSAVNSTKSLTVKAGTPVILTSTSGGTSTVKYKDKLYYVSRSKLSITDMYTKHKAFKTEDVTAYVNKQKFTSRSKYLLYVSAYSQHVYLFTGKKGSWKLKYSMPCSTGKFSTQTNYGRTTICGKQMDWYFEGYVCAHYASMVWGGGQAIHTWPTAVGWPASHGCIRVPTKYAIFIYQNVPVGTAVYVL